MAEDSDVLPKSSSFSISQQNVATDLDQIESTLKRVHEEVETRKTWSAVRRHAQSQQLGSRPRSLNLATLYCNEMPVADGPSSPQSFVAFLPSPPRSLTSTVPSSVTSVVTSQTDTLSLVKQKPLLPPGLRGYQRSNFRQQQRQAYRHREQQERNFAAGGGILSASRRCVSELGGLILMLRHLLAEVPLLVLLATTATTTSFSSTQQTLGPLFYLTLAFTCAPGLAALITLLCRTSRGTPCLQSVVRCIAVSLRLEAVLRVVEAALPTWRLDGPSWPQLLALPHAAAGSVPQLILQSAALGLCARIPSPPGPTPPPTEQLVVFRGMEKLGQLLEVENCDGTVAILQATVVLLSAAHIAWALASQAKLPSSAATFVPASAPGGLVQLVRRTSLVLAVLANLLIAGSRAALAFLVVSSGQPTWLVAAVFGGWGVISLGVGYARYAWGSSSCVAPALCVTVCELVAIQPVSGSSRILARKCVITVIQNTALLVGAALCTHGATDAGAVYRLGVLTVASCVAGMLLLAARLHWVHGHPAVPTPLPGKCFQYRPTQEVLQDEGL